MIASASPPPDPSPALLALAKAALQLLRCEPDLGRRVAAAIDVIDIELVEPAKGGVERPHVAVDVGEDGSSPIHHRRYGFRRQPRASSALAAAKAATATSAVTTSDSQSGDS